MVVVGSINVDQLVSVERRPGPGETVGDATLELHPGGKGANQAVAAARCGAAVAMVGRIGDDATGRAQLEELAAEHVDVHRVLLTEGEPTGMAVVLLTPEGENSIIVVPGANRCLTSGDLAAAKPEIGRAKVLLAQLEVPIEAVSAALELRGRDTRVVLNWSPFRGPIDSLLRSTSVLVANEHETTALSGRPVRDPNDAVAAASEIVRMGPPSVVVTLGTLGAVAVTSDMHAHVPAEKVDVVDTTGAGDAFVGALAARLSEGVGLVDAVRFGVAVGSATTTRRGARAVLPGDRFAPTERLRKPLGARTSHHGGPRP